ncbi:bifunctional phosphopantothenoylcysteine decarboxylase/phosphopantothenate--cysteine ligase CoaBC [Glycomyces sp. TRM65418]|uniref:bifunctional phosphopantothenoylcysteine decarboxylase/phosphopantothenate--cysteine ligase CoaBC n=1 Tax=Glycomyces sp. TRM65418 TaxID=2867006 RepID=UPI001CE5D144|nr:bifunctional phosphopantothenoylcysteine decarboxylase/phosphopantothenate--cysteine ligase CoaBC [Glycomyces sp. TRM65418]MCC3764401.1 bifunctional phosphopantothenoylcysteine decarboxylase/phosphopantothenate--cysteine ligase CoaBC [Glycomyces sp. TRM65418]QZD54077.1 bifunctional phosphopantothenoylcysteine decarboxylase/phosphopantothenate--cysteine ligase CoaBC [Glycomyces sp. TRM65418]
MNIVLGVSGGIAAYKACILLRLLKESGHDVTVIPTEAALKFVGEATWEALSGHQVASGVFSDVSEVKHVRLGRHADLVVVAPATADLLARAAHGRADDLLTSTLLTATCPVVFAPAMHTEMWEHAATRANVATLRERGAHVVEPDSGRLTGADTGPGRLPEPESLFALVKGFLARPSTADARTGADAEPIAGTRDLAGRKVLVTAGGTREPIDPVRFIGNHSSGRQGIALAAAAAARGADVHLIAAHLDAPLPAGISVERVSTTGELYDATVKAAAEADAAVLAAAPADFTPKTSSDRKLKRKGDLELALTATPDIAAAVGRAKRDGQVLVVFAAETHDGPEHAKAKREAKGADLVVLNDVSGGAVFGAAENSVTVFDERGEVDALARASKEAVADAIWDAVAARLPLSGRD